MLNPEQYSLWLRLIYGPAVIMNPLFAFWINMLTIKAEPTQHPNVERVMKK